MMVKIFKALMAMAVRAFEAFLPLAPTDLALANVGSARDFCPKQKGGAL